MHARLLLTCTLLALPGCLSGRTVKPRIPWDVGHLYLQGTGPIYVEVDASAGCEPGSETLAALQAFLAQHTRREVVLGEVETLSNSYLTHHHLALKHFDGPPAALADADFIYLQLHAEDPIEVGFGQPVLGYVPGLYPAAIFINREALEDGSWIPWDTWRSNLSDVLLHEAGHVLGQVFDAEGWESHGDEGPHCANGDCLMAPASNFSWWASFFRITAQPNPLCDACLADLERRRREPHRQRFRSGFLIREADDYWVAAGPALTVVGIDPVEDVDWDRLRQQAREALDQDRGRWHVSGRTPTRLALYAAPGDPTRRRDQLRRLRHAARDPHPIVAAAAAEWVRELEADAGGDPIPRWR